MFDFQQKRQIKKIIYSRVTIVILFIIVIFLGRSTYDIYTRYKLSENNYLSAKKDYDNLKTRQAMLDSEISRLKTEAGTEEEIRSRFNVAKPGEVVVTVIGSTSSPAINNSQNISLWQQFVNMFR